MSYEASTVWICDECSKRKDSAGGGFPPEWFDLDRGSGIDNHAKWESWDFCSWKCVQAFAAKQD